MRSTMTLRTIESTGLAVLAVLAALLLASCPHDPSPAPAPTLTPTTPATATAAPATPQTPAPTLIPTPEETISERKALVALYEATGGANWHNNTNWLSDAPLGEWHGVTTDDGGRVIRLDLGGDNEIFGNGLMGELPPELGVLSNLRELNLRGNQLGGQIPPELGVLSNLREVNLSANQLGGQIPPELGGLFNLERLSLSGNELSGEIPPELDNLLNLRGCFQSVS